MTNLNTNDFIKGWDRNTIASKIADDLPHSSYVNLGIGMPELVSQYIREDREIIYHSENGLLGMGPSPNEELAQQIQKKVERRRGVLLSWFK